MEWSQPDKHDAGYVASLRFTLSLNLEPSPAGAADPANFKFALGTSPKGGVSWLNAVRGAGKIVATAEEVSVRETAPARTTVIDRRTGFLRSIRLDLPSGEGKIVKTSDVVVKAAHPDIALPERWNDRPGRVSDALAMVVPILGAQAGSDIAEILKEWPRAGSEDRAGALRDYIAWLAAEYDALNRTNIRLGYAAHFVKESVERGASLDELSRDLDAQAKAFADVVRAGEARPKQAAIMTEALISFRQSLEKAAGKAKGSDEARSILVRRIQEGFEPDRVRKAVPSVPDPDYARILREAIDAAREREAK